MAERELAIVVRARDLASKGIKNIRKNIDVLGKSGKQAINGLSNAMTRLATGSAVALVGAIALGAKSLGKLERVTNQTNAVIKSTKGAAGQSTEAIRKHAEALEQLTTADDKAIQEGQNMLLTFTKIGGKTFPKATKAAVDMAIAMAKGDVANADFAGTAIQVGKALNDPIKGVTALSKAGVSFTEQQKKQIKTLVAAGKIEQAQAIILKELALEFGNAGKAAGEGFEADIRRVQDAGEDATAALARGVMPALSKFATFLSTKLADPAVIATLDGIGREIGQAAEQAIAFIEKVDFKAVGRGLKDGANAAKGIVSAFMGMPDWVKQAVIGGWGLNKITGGALSSLLGGVIKGVLGMTAGVVNLKAGVVNGGGAGVPGGGGGGKLGAIASIPVAGAIIAAAVPIGEAFAAALPPWLKGADGTGKSEAQTRLGPLLDQKKPAFTLPQLTTMNDEQRRTNERLGGIAGKIEDDRRATVAAATRVGLAAQRAGERSAGASRSAGQVAKSGGLAAARAIDRKNLSVRIPVTVNVSAKLSTRNTSAAITAYRTATGSGR